MSDSQISHANKSANTNVNTKTNSPAPWSWTLRWLGLAGMVIALDQYTKKLVLQHLPLGGELEVLPFFSWVYWRNYGAAFSFLNDAGGWQRWGFVALAVGFSGFLIFELRRLRRVEIAQALAFALILGGALGNMLDRAVLGFVVDFAKFHWGASYFPAFNVADSAIFLGAATWFVLIFREMRAGE